MQASDRILARRYAQALFQVGIEHKQEERLHQELSDAMKLLRDHMEVFRHPMMGATKQKALLMNIIGPKISGHALKFLELLIEKKRFFLLPIAAMDYGTMLDDHRGLARAQVRVVGKFGEAE